MPPKHLPLAVDIKAIREELGLSQAEFAALLAVSPRTIQSCEQELRVPSSGVEKTALLLLMAHRHGADFSKHLCWKATRCPREVRGKCIVYRSRQGHLCWFLTGTYCRGVRVQTWAEKLALCEECDFFAEVAGGRLVLRRARS